MLGQSGIIKLILSGLLVFGFGLFVHKYMPLYLPQQLDLGLEKKNIDFQASDYNAVQFDGIETNPVPDDKKIDEATLSIKKYKISLKNRKNKDIFVRENGIGKNKILLLHDRGSSSQIWEDIGTLQNLKKWGYQAYAIDVPNMAISNQEAIQLIKNLIDKLNLQNLVIISPSVSGRLTLPYIFQSNGQQKSMKGFVPIAPVGTEKYNITDFKKVKIPTLIVHGDKDKKFQYAFNNLKQIPNSKILLIKDASHTSYIEKSDQFHNALRQFLDNIYRPIQKKPPNLSKKNPSNLSKKNPSNLSNKNPSNLSKKNPSNLSNKNPSNLSNKNPVKNKIEQPKKSQ